MSKYKRGNSVTVGIGIPTILVLFIILAMVILSLLGYLKEENNSKIVQREIEFTRNYYKADAKAKYILETNDIEYAKNECDEFSNNNEVLKFIINIDEKRELSVIKDNNKIIEYKLITRGE